MSGIMPVNRRPSTERRGRPGKKREDSASRYSPDHRKMMAPAPSLFEPKRALIHQV
jgi:hypothetical protein